MAKIGVEGTTAFTRDLRRVLGVEHVITPILVGRPTLLWEWLQHYDAVIYTDEGAAGFQSIVFVRNPDGTFWGVPSIASTQELGVTLAFKNLQMALRAKNARTSAFIGDAEAPDADHLQPESNLVISAEEAEDIRSRAANLLAASRTKLE